jgi:hypothetical protein
MKKYKVEHIVLCEVRTYRIIEAENMNHLLGKVAAIETLTDGSNCDYEIISDRDAIQIDIKEITRG